MNEKYIVFHSKFIRRDTKALTPRCCRLILKTQMNPDGRCEGHNVRRGHTLIIFPWTAAEIIATNGDAGHPHLDSVRRCRRTRGFMKWVFVSPPPPRQQLLLRPPPNLIMFCSTITSLMLNKVCGVAMVTPPHPPM